MATTPIFADGSIPSQPATHEAGAAVGPRLDHGLHPSGRWVFLALLVGGLGYAGFSIFADTARSARRWRSASFAFLGLALLIALGFEFVNGFHDTANAVATVIYTHSMPRAARGGLVGLLQFPRRDAVVGRGRLFDHHAAAGRPDPACRQRGGFAMIFALLLAAIIWNLATWFVGLPNSSSHALIGSILGVGLANQLLRRAGGTSGVDWRRRRKSCRRCCSAR